MDVSAFPPALPHGPLVLIFGAADLQVYQVTGAARMAPGVSFPRNMQVISYRGELSLVSAVRLTDTGLAELAQLGRIKHVIRIGQAHSSDDAFYLHRFAGAQHWAMRRHTMRFGATVSCVLDEHSLLPFPGRVWCFKTLTRTDEAALVMPKFQLLITCDSVHNVVDYAGTTPLAVLAMRAIGLGGPAAIGVGWITANHHEREGRPLVEDFERLLVDVPFQNLLTAHGRPITDGTAHKQLAASVADFARRGLLTGRAVPRRRARGVAVFVLWMAIVALVLFYLVTRGLRVQYSA